MESHANDLELAFDSPDSKPSIEDAVATAQTSERLRQAILQLSESEQEVVSLLVERDLDLSDIAAITMQPLGPVKSHVHRAKIKLKTILVKDML